MKLRFFITVLMSLIVSSVMGQASLVSVVASEQRELALQLIAQGSDVNTTQSDGTSALMYASHQGDVGLVEALIEAQAKVNLSNAYGASAISEALIFGSAEIAEMLLKNGADANLANPEGETPLMIAARGGNLEAARLLIEHGADVNAIERWGGQSALMWASAQGHPALMKLLIEQGVDVDIKGFARIWKRRITAEPRPKDMNKGGFSALHYAARQGCSECVMILAEAGADLDPVDPDRVSPLNLALINLHFNTAAALIAAGADVDNWDLFGRTPLYNAIDLHTLPIGGRSDIPSQDSLSGYEIAKMLLERGANPNLQLKLLAPYRNAVFDRASDKVLYTGATTIMRAAKAADNASVKLLLEYGAHPDIPNAKGQTPLMVVSGIAHTSAPTRGRYKTEVDSIETIRLLLEAGADINAISGNPALRPGQVLLDADRGRLMHPANRGEVVIDGQTALHGAGKQGWSTIAQYLIDNGARQQIADAIGNTPFDLAMGRYAPAYNDSPPAPFLETAALLQEACEVDDACVMDAPLDFK